MLVSFKTIVDGDFS